jgi:hypothetical protein
MNSVTPTAIDAQRAAHFNEIITGLALTSWLAELNSRAQALRLSIETSVKSQQLPPREVVSAVSDFCRDLDDHFADLGDEISGASTSADLLLGNAVRCANGDVLCPDQVDDEDGALSEAAY